MSFSKCLGHQIIGTLNVTDDQRIKEDNRLIKRNQGNMLKKKKSFEGYLIYRELLCLTGRGTQLRYTAMDLDTLIDLQMHTHLHVCIIAYIHMADGSLHPPPCFVMVYTLALN